MSCMNQPYIGKNQKKYNKTIIWLMIMKTIEEAYLLIKEIKVL